MANHPNRDQVYDSFIERPAKALAVRKGIGLPEAVDEFLRTPEGAEALRAYEAAEVGKSAQQAYEERARFVDLRNAVVSFAQHVDDQDWPVNVLDAFTLLRGFLTATIAEAFEKADRELAVEEGRAARTYGGLKMPAAALTMAANPDAFTDLDADDDNLRDPITKAATERFPALDAAEAVVAYLDTAEGAEHYGRTA